MSFIELWNNESRHGGIAIATRSGEKYRGKGYASKNADNMVKWINRYGNMHVDDVVWEVKEGNEASRKLAEQYGFKYDKHSNGYIIYKMKVK